MKVKIGPYPKHRWYHNFLYTKFGIKNDQRVSIHIDKYDTWSMDETLSLITLPMLKQLKSNTNSSPSVSLEDVPIALHTEDMYFERWAWVLGEMIFAHQSVLEEGEMEFYSHVKIPITADTKLLHSTLSPPVRVTVDTEGLDAYRKRKQNGFRLFGKYYENLWD